MAGQWFNVAWYERGARGFWLMLAGFLAAFLALGLIPTELIEAPRARAALGASPVIFFLAGFFSPNTSFKRSTRAVLFGAMSSLTATCFTLWVAGAQASKMIPQADLVLSGFIFCAAIGMIWGAACFRSKQAQPLGQLAYLAAKGAPEELARAGARALSHLAPDWALDPHLKQEGRGSWRVTFPARPGFFLAVEIQGMASDELDGNAEAEALLPELTPEVLLETKVKVEVDLVSTQHFVAQPCLVALALEPGQSPAEWLAGHASGLDPMGLRPAFCTELARELPGCAPHPLG